ncbi:MAG: hypothetical protein CMJ87_00300 [Planctomycetes bacterium]|nr:hypothetical protein [Planctomycetota bacterium]
MKTSLSRPDRNRQAPPGPDVTPGVLLAASLGFACNAPLLAEYSVERHEILLSAGSHKTVLTGTLLPGPHTAVAVAEVGPDGEPQLHIFGFDGITWQEQSTGPLGPNTSFIDVAMIDGRKRLLTFESGRLSWFDTDSAQLIPLLEIDFHLLTPGVSGLPAIDLTRDLNQDGRDDVIVPASDGFQIALQLEDGSFAQPIKLGPAEPFLKQCAMGDSRTYGEVGLTPETYAWYLSRVHSADFDGDGLVDLAFWDEGHFEVYPQHQTGHFATSPTRYPCAVPIDSDGAYSLVFGFAGESLPALLFGFRKNTSHTVLHTLRDLNADGTPELVTRTLTGRSVLNLRTTFQAYFGEQTASGLHFMPDTEAIANPGGRTGGLETGGYSSVWFEDLDGDGPRDLLLMDVDMGIVRGIAALLGFSIVLDFETFRLAEGSYPSEPSSRFRVKTDFSPTDQGQGSFSPAVLVGDMTGDGRQDLVVTKSREQVLIFPGTAGPDPLSAKPHTLHTSVPGHEWNVRLVDLDRDNKQDLLMLHTYTASPQRLLLLLSR